MRDGAKRRRRSQLRRFGGGRELALDLLKHLGRGHVDRAEVEPARRRVTTTLAPLAAARVAVEPRPTKPALDLPTARVARLRLEVRALAGLRGDDDDGWRDGRHARRLDE
jgi:hypothetical protein